MMIVSSLLGFSLIAMRRLGYRFPGLFPFFYTPAYGLMDLLVPITMFASAVLLSLAVWKLRKEPGIAKSKYRVFLFGFYLMLIALFIFDSGEETSWGQDFFHWRTPTLFAGNLENETNIHNYFNVYFKYAYIALSLILVIVLFSAWLESQQRWLVFNRFVLPHPSLLGLSIFIAFVAIVWYGDEELLEEMIAAFALFYCLRIFLSAHSNKLSITT